MKLYVQNGDAVITFAVDDFDINIAPNVKAKSLTTSKKVTTASKKHDDVTNVKTLYGLHYVV